jgi:thioredoxin 1
MSPILDLNEETFENEVLEEDIPVLVDFGAVWCGPCKMLDPIVEEISEELISKLKVVRIDVDHSPDTAMKYQVMGVPTLMLFKAGTPVERLTGYMPKNKILSKLEPHI